jgi:hypothetical protein
MYSEIKIKQPRFNILKKIFKNHSKDSVFEMEESTFHNLEYDNDDRKFMWSRPKSRILLSNVDTLKFTVDSGMDRNFTIILGKVYHVYKLRNGGVYKFSIDTYGLSYISFSINEYLPENDHRSLGVRFYDFETC